MRRGGGCLPPKRPVHVRELPRRPLRTVRGRPPKRADCGVDPMSYTRLLSCGQSKRRKPCFQACPLRLQPGGKYKLRTQLFRSFVHGEAWRIRRDFEKDAAWFPVIDRVEILPVHHRRNPVVETSKLRPPASLLVIVGCPPGDVVNRADQHAARPLVWGTKHVPQPCRFAGIDGGQPTMTNNEAGG